MSDRSRDPVRPTLLDRALAQISPRLGAERMAGRIAFRNLEALGRDYWGAGRGRGTEGWRSPSTSADAEIAKGGPILRARMRDLVRNNPVAANAVQVLVSSLIGAGIRPRAASADKNLNRRVDALWTEWSMQADFHGHTDFHGLLALAARQTVEGGEVLALRHWTRAARGLAVPLQIELKEADHFDDTKTETTKGGLPVVQGIEFDRDGRRSAYWLYPEHPGDMARYLRRSGSESVRVPGDRVAHMFERQRMQIRGVPWGAPVIRSLRDFDDWHNAELVRKKLEACVVGVLINSDGAGDVAPTIKDQDNKAIAEMQPGMIGVASGATDIRFNQPTAAGGVYEWNSVMLHLIASGFRVPYALLTGDLRQANFASSRVGLNEFRRMIDMLQWQMVIPQLCQPVWGWFIEAAFTAGRIGAERVPVEWAPPSFESVNPLQDAQADQLDVRSGFRTTPQMIAKRGYDPMTNLAEQAAFNAAADAEGMVFDSDPRKVAKSGQAQVAAKDDGATPDDDGADGGDGGTTPPAPKD